MPTQLRLLGVHGKNAPTKKSKTVTASDFAIAGLIGKFERKYTVPFEITSPIEEQEIFGGYINPNTYGKDVLKTFWDNLAGSRAKIWVKSHVGYTGSVIDAVVANQTISDLSAVPTLKFESAYKENLDYGTSGNRTGFKIVNGSRYSTQLASGILATDTIIPLISVIGVMVGDIVKMSLSGGTVYRKVVSIDESLNKIVIDTSVGVIGTISDPVDVIGIQVKTYRKSLSGIETEVETALGQTWCTLEAENQEYYIQNVHAKNKWLKVTDLASSSLYNIAYPSNSPVTVYLSGGLDGTSPVSVSHWSLDLQAFNGLPIRMLGNCETISVDVHKAGETYCKSRLDTPFWIPVIQKNQDVSSLKVIGSGYQRSDDVFQVNVAEWLKINDPYNNSPIAPDRQIPNIGAVMGAWIRTIASVGIHVIPAVDQITLLGINGVVNDAIGENIGDDIRTDIASYGINIIQFVEGSGFRIRNFFTPSTTLEFQFANGLIMRNFIKVSSEQSLQSSENTPNSFNRIKEDRDAIKSFLYRLWFKGNTNNVPTGETFGQQELPDGTLTTPEDHFEVIADAVNNPMSSINAGNRNIQVYFTYPTPAGSIQIDVGILLR